MKAKVYLIGAGPGDPGLITVKGRACIAAADVVVYDYLASPALLQCARPDAELVYVGKKGGDHTLPQEEINALLVAKAAGGAVVARLKGGDPYIFGRGAEEAEVLVAAGIAYEVVPGVTSAIAAPAYAGIPLTHRDFTSTLAFVTGHEDPTKAASSIDWEALARGIGTLVFFMGVKNLPHITRQLTAHGMSPDKPVAVVRWGTTAAQQTVTGTLATIEGAVRAAGVKAPAIIVVGEVVGLRDRLQWFEKRPLMGKTVVVTRAREQASDLVFALSGLGAACLECPTIQVAAAADGAPLEQAIANLGSYDWIVFTSVNGVRFFFERLFAQGRDVRALGHLRTAAIGPATAERLRSFGLTTDILPDSYRAEAVAAAFAREAVRGKKILLPRAREARSVLPEALRAQGAIVAEVVAYETRAVADAAEALLQRLEKRQIDLVTFTSSSTVKNFKALLPPADFERLMAGVTVASIGPITSETACGLGFEVHISAQTYTIPGLCEAIVAFYART